MSSIQIISRQMALHTRLFNNTLEDISDAGGNERMNEHVNHLQWIAGHLANTRYNYAAMLGSELKFPYKEKYSDPTKPPPANRSIDASIEYPSLSEIKKYWNALAPEFTEKLAALDNDKLMTEMPFSTPIGGKTMLDLFAFISSHEAYHIGQMSLIRKYLGKDAMSFK